LVAVVVELPRSRTWSSQVDRRLRCRSVNRSILHFLCWLFCRIKRRRRQWWSFAEHSLLEISFI